MVYYFLVCKRKLWFFGNEIQMEKYNEAVKTGKIIDKCTYRNEEKHINIDNIISIDFIRDRNCLHEIKKSRKIEEASIMQVKYYLYYLKQKGVKDIKGEIDYPLIKQNLSVELTADDEIDIERMLSDIKKIITNPKPPEIEKKGICKACAYYDICFI